MNLHAHLLRHTALRKTAQEEGLSAAVKKAGHSRKTGATHIWRYIQMSEEDFEKAEEKLFR